MPATKNARQEQKLPNTEIVRAFSRQEVTDRPFLFGMEPVGSAPRELATLMNSEIVRLGKVNTGIDIREKP
jgi:hypothetical protein